MAWLANNETTRLSSQNSEESYHPSEDTSLDDNLCNLCNKEMPKAKMITCDECGNIFHLKCVNLTEIPCSWTCSNCKTKSKSISESFCQVCKEDEIKLCHMCEAIKKKVERKDKNLQHQYCLICENSITENFWQCKYCKIKCHKMCAKNYKLFIRTNTCAECNLFLSYKSLKLLKHFN